MASKINIINQALSKLGEPALETLSDDTKQAREALLIYDDKRQSLIQEHPWNFAVKRALLPALPAAPVFKYATAFQIPSDSLRILELEFEDDSPWEVEGQTIVTDDEGPANIKYISDIVDPNLMTPQFREVLAAFLAWSMAESLVKTSTVKSALGVEYNDKLRTARSMDGSEADSYRREISRDSWVNARIVGIPGQPGDRFN